MRSPAGDPGIGDETTVRAVPHAADEIAQRQPAWYRPDLTHRQATNPVVRSTSARRAVGEARGVGGADRAKLGEEVLNVGDTRPQLEAIPGQPLRPPRCNGGHRSVWRSLRPSPLHV